MESSAQASPDQIRRLASVQLDVFAGLVMPEIAVYAFPPFYQELWILCIRSFMELSPDNKLFKLLLVLPRGHAKTTFIKLLVAYLIIHRLADFVMVLCASDGNAESFAKDVSSMLSHQNVRKLYGDWEAGLKEDNAAEKVGYFMGRKCILKAASILSGSVRGTQKEMKRPDVIVFDDVQTKEVAESEKKTEVVEDAIFGTALLAASPHRCGVVYIGNSYPRNCIADKIAASGEFITLRTGAILASGESLWPELHSIASLRSSWRIAAAVGKGHLWMAEIQNQPLEQDGVRPLLPDGDFQLTILDPGYQKIAAFVTVDPAGSNKGADDTAIGGHVVWEGMQIQLVALEAALMDPRQTIITALRMAERVQAPLIFVEAVAYQASLCFWGQEVLKELHLDHLYTFVPLQAGKASKLARIRAWVGELLGGQYCITDQETKQKILYQALVFDARKTDNRDDLLDTAAFGTVIRNHYMAEVLEASYQFGIHQDKLPVERTSGSGLSRQLSLTYGNR